MQQIVIVDEQDNCIGEEEKEKCHDGDGILHRAFLAMLFNREGELILARRSGGKRLWPGYWDGTVASHVTMGEDYEQSSKRRLGEELGIEPDKIKYLFKFRYKAGYKDVGTEHEICAVLVVNGIDTDELALNRDEVSDIRTVELQTLAEEVRKGGQPYTPWLALALEHMQERHIIGQVS